MGELRIRGVDDATVELIASRARLHGRTVEREVISLIQEALGPHADPPREDRATMVRRIAAMTPKDIVQTDSVILIREDRDR